MQFTDLGLSEVTLSALKRLGYKEPTEVQSKSIPAALEGRDIAIAAKTGTGKTASFALPIVNHPKKGKNKAPFALIVSPTRELAQQIDKVLSSLAQVTGHRVATLVGGVPYGKQIKRLKSNPDIIVATPGRLQDMMDRRFADLSKIEILVLDEADRMLDMGFLPAMKKIFEKTPTTRQTMLFSATIDRKVMNSIGNLLKNPLFIEVSHKGETADKIEQFVVPISQKRKSGLLQAVLRERGSEKVIIFARTKRRSDSCADDLNKAGYNAEAIHSDLSQGQRRRALDNFHKGKTKILVATDVLARGIDVSGVKHVINYDLPDCADDYVHRIGRTARAGKEGDAISFVSPDTRASLRDIEKLVGISIPAIEIEGFDTSMESLANKKPVKSGTKYYGNRNKRSNGSRNDYRRNDNRKSGSRKNSSKSRKNYAVA